MHLLHTGGYITRAGV